MSNLASQEELCFAYIPKLFLIYSCCYRANVITDIAWHS
jgi:hypothetical protein